MNKRQAGVLLHPTSLPNKAGDPGQLNEEVWRFLDWMEEAGLSIWQTLPLTRPHDDGSPYHALSTFAMNPDLLPEEWLAQVDEDELADYLEAPPHWLDEYALFMAIRQKQGGRAWFDWPHELKMRDPQALQNFAETHHAAIRVLKTEQFALDKRWQQVKREANRRGIELLGDMPIFVAYDSVDVWANPRQFKLDDNLSPTVVTGVPPDYFSETGQRWGNPHYDWEVMQANGFEWWCKRISESLRQFDFLRLDHFRGLEAVWEIDADEETAVNGKWVETPGEVLLQTLQESFPDLPLVAEDLGIITEDVVRLKERFGLPGMSVLQFGFNGLPDNPHSLEGQVENAITYTGTHDNDTTLGWFDHLDEGTRSWVLEKLQPLVTELLEANALLTEMPWPMIAAAMDSVAQRAVVPMQDWLMLGSEHRMNVPGTTEGNWRWQFQWQQVPDDLSADIRTLLKATQRLNGEVEGQAPGVAEQ